MSFKLLEGFSLYNPSPLPFPLLISCNACGSLIAYHETTMVMYTHLKVCPGISARIAAEDRERQ